MYNLKTKMMKRLYFTITAFIALVQTNVLQPNYGKAQFIAPPTIVETFQSIPSNAPLVQKTINDGGGRQWEFFGALTSNSNREARPLAPRLSGVSTNPPTTGGYIATKFAVKGLKRVAVQFMPYAANAAAHDQDAGTNGFTLAVYTSINNGTDWIKQGDKTTYKDGGGLADPVVLDISLNIPATDNVLIKLVNESPSAGAYSALLGNRVNILQVVIYDNETKPAFTPGNLVLYRHNIGASVNSSQTLTATTTNMNGNLAVPVYLDEYKLATDGNSLELVQSVPVPSVAPDVASAPLATLGNTVNEGRMTRSYDGRYLVIPGYGVTPGITASSVNNSRAVDAPRAVGLVDFNGNMNTKTALTTGSLFDEQSYRSATSYNGAGVWLTGGTGSSYGVQYAATGSNVALTDPLAGGSNSPREIKFADGNLYLLTETQLCQIGSGQPTADVSPWTGTAVTLPGIDNTNKLSSFYMAGVGANKVLYVADLKTGNQFIRKFSLVSGSWVANGTLSLANAQAIEGVVDNGTVKLFVISNTDNADNGDSKVYLIADAAGFNATITSTAPKLLLDKTGTKTNFRGIAFAPVAESVLPVKLNSFGAKYQNNGVQLSWKTSSETNNSYFEVLRSDGSGFKKIGTVKGNGNSNSGQTYHFTDVRPLAGLSYYQLRQVDFDGKSTLSDVVSVKVALAVSGLSVSAAADMQQVQLAFSTDKAGTANIAISNINGQKVAQSTQQAKKGQNSIAVQAPLKKGAYIVTLALNGAKQASKLVVK